ncbi:hypothetical protein GCM10027288_47350 [Bordetella tumbae]
MGGRWRCCALAIAVVFLASDEAGYITATKLIAVSRRHGRARNERAAIPARLVLAGKSVAYASARQK